MELQLIQTVRFITFIIFVGAAWYFYKKNSMKGILTTAAIALILLVFPPINFGGGSNMSTVAPTFQSERVLPERIEVKRESYEERMNTRKAELQQQRGEIQNEID